MDLYMMHKYWQTFLMCINKQIISQRGIIQINLFKAITHSDSKFL